VTIIREERKEKDICCSPRS